MWVILNWLVLDSTYKNFNLVQSLGEVPYTRLVMVVLKRNKYCQNNFELGITRTWWHHEKVDEEKNEREFWNCSSCDFKNDFPTERKREVEKQGSLLLDVFRWNYPILVKNFEDTSRSKSRIYVRSWDINIRRFLDMGKFQKSYNLPILCFWNTQISAFCFSRSHCSLQK